MEIGVIARLRDPRIRRRAILVATSLLLIWLTFFDSHSIARRIAWHRELNHLQIENVRLQTDIEQLETELEKGLTDDRVEKIAREQYHMKKPGETVHQVEDRR